MRRLYIPFAMAVTMLYGASVWGGWEMGSAKEGFNPATVRQSPGGYRSFFFARGGK